MKVADGQLEIDHITYHVAFLAQLGLSLLELFTEMLAQLLREALVDDATVQLGLDYLTAERALSLVVCAGLPNAVDAEVVATGQLSRLNHDHHANGAALVFL